MDDDLLSIGRFARLAGLSVGALRHYDELDLLRPAEIDASTGYRRYRTSQLDDARTIARLRELEVPLEEIRDVLAADDPAERARRLADHRARIEARTYRLQRVLHHVQGVVERKEPIVTKPPGPPELDQATRRALAAGLFNHTWTLLETRPAHAGPGRRDDPRRARVAVPLGRDRATTCTSPAASGSAPGSTRSSAASSRPSGTPAGASSWPRPTPDREDWDLPAAYEAMARALHVAGDAAAAAEWKAKATEALGAVADAEDRTMIEQDLASLP